MTTPAYAYEIGEHLPSEEVQQSAGQLRDLLVAEMEDGVELRTGSTDPHIKEIQLAPELTMLLVQLLGHLRGGDGVTFVPISKLLTTQQAADILNVSRPFLVKLLEDGAMPFEKIGRHRRVKAKYLFEYKRKREAERAAAMEQLLESDGELY